MIGSGEDTNPVLIKRAEAMAGMPVRAITPAGQGANSHIMRLDTSAGPFALKVYPRRPNDQRDRLEVEWQALQFLGRNNLRQAPSAFARDDESRLMLMEWIEGNIITRHGPDDLEDALMFVEGIFNASHNEGALSFPLASEACLLAQEICRQIDRRLAGFVRFGPLDEFIAGTVQPAYDKARKGVQAELEDPVELPRSEQRLIPADFGFHNAIRQRDGIIRYIDFDYFGWDDPVKFIADFVLHPAMSLDPSEQAQVVARLTAALPDAGVAADRLRRHLPLYEIRWALILLNPFRVDREAALPASASQRADVFDRQCSKARSMIGRGC